jgi:hypothetical protein
MSKNTITIDHLLTERRACMDAIGGPQPEGDSSSLLSQVRCLIEQVDRYQHAATREAESNARLRTTLDAERKRADDAEWSLTMLGRLDKSELRGQAARMDGEPRGANPYADSDDELASAWNDGWERQDATENAEQARAALAARADNAERERDEAQALAEERGGMVAGLRDAMRADPLHDCDGYRHRHAECWCCRALSDTEATAQAHDERVRGEALREAADAAEDSVSALSGSLAGWARSAVAEWLRGRADAATGGSSP